MNIAIAIERFDPLATGIERSTQQIASHLIGRGHRVTIITGEAPPNLTLEGGQIISGHTVNFRHRVSVGAFARWAPAALAQQQADVTLSMTMACPAMLVQPRSGTLASRLQREQVAADMLISKRRRASMQWLNLPRNAGLKRERVTATNPGVRKFIAISEYVASQLDDDHSIDAEKIAHIPAGLDLPQLSAQDRTASRTQIREGFHIPAESPALLFFAQHDAHLKGISPLLLATRELVDQGRDLTLLLAGHIPYRDQVHVEKLKLRPQVRMIGPTNRIAPLLSAADVTVLPSFFDPCSRIILESLMMGLPVVTSRYNGASDVLNTPQGRDCGRVVADPSDIDGLAAAITAMLNPAASSVCLSHVAHWRETLSMARHVDRLESLMHEVIG